MLSSCERRPLHDLNGQIRVRIDVDRDVLNAGTLPEPEVMRVLFYDPETMQKVSEDYVGPNGGYVSIRPGNYRMLVYNFDTESTLVQDDRDYWSIKAYTNDVSSSKKSMLVNAITKSRQQIMDNSKDPDTKVSEEDQAWAEAMKTLTNSDMIYEPDHLFVGREDVNILNVTGEQVFHADASSVVETYYLSVRIKNITNMASATAILTGQIASNYIGYTKEDGKTDTNVLLSFEMQSGSDSESNDVVYTYFNTFGKNPNVESTLWLTIILRTGDGSTVEWHKEITDEFMDNPEQWIELEEDVIELPEPEITPGGGGGGFQPGVSEWDEEHHEITI